MVDWYWQWKLLGKNPVLVPRTLPQAPHELPWARTRALATSSKRSTTCAVEHTLWNRTIGFVNSDRKSWVIIWEDKAGPILYLTLYWKLKCYMHEETSGDNVILQYVLRPTRNNKDRTGRQAETLRSSGVWRQLTLFGDVPQFLRFSKILCLVDDV